ncbi:MAG TPA: IPT/TIG domain-containing protein [Vicinamibacteria bacterium]|nr:IPT/TIG domain-containing protein [Vicinamibacteria bacterium]
MADAPHTASLTVLGGPLKGRSHAFEDAVEEVFIGSDPDCQLCLNLPGVSPIHARVWLEVGGATVHDTHSPLGVFVNDDRVTEKAPLRDGDFLWLGSPGAAESVLLQFRGPAPAAAQAAEAPEEEVWVIEEAPEEPVAVAPVVAPAETATETAAEWFFAEVEPAESAAAAVQAPVVAEAPAEAQEFFFEDEPASSQLEPPPPGPAFDEFLLEDAAAGQPGQEEPAFEVGASDASFLVEGPASAPPARSAPPAPPPVKWEVADAPAPQLPRAQPPVIPQAPPPPAPVSPPAPPPQAAPRPPSPAPSAPRPAAPTPGPVRRPAPAPPARRPARSGAGRLVALAALVVVVLGGGGVAAWWFLLRGPRIDAAEPRQVRPGDTVTLTGKNFAADAAGNLVRFKGDKPGRVLRVSPTQLQVEVPEVGSAPGREEPVPVVVSVDGKDSAPFELLLTAAPRIHGLSPSVAMPDEEITLAGGGWGVGVKVHFGTVEAQVLEVKPNAVRVRVPALTEPIGTALPVVVSMGTLTSNTAPFAIGHLPLLTAIEPQSAGPGDVVVIKGRGFHLRASANLLKIGGAVALVLQASDTEIKAIVPRAAENPQASVELKVPASEHLGQATLALGGLPDPLTFRFVAEPFFDGSAHDHALLSTGLGPAFVLSASGGRSAAERALEAQNRLNGAVDALRAGAAPDITVRLDASPAVVLGGSGSPLLEVSDEDAAAYNEDWTDGRGRGGPATAVRLALWWGAVARDLAMALARSERPKHATSLAPEGKALIDLYDAVKKGSKAGLTREAVAKAKPAVREAARAAVLRVPASVLPPVAPVPVPAGGAQPAPSAPPKVEAFRLEGTWSGVERDSGETRYVTLNFTKSGGSLTYERALSLTVPLLSVEQPQRGSLRYSLRSGASTRYYAGRWDGQKVQGRICSDADCKTATGTFELVRSR